MPRLKILQIGSSMPDDWGGIERYVAYLAPALAARGHDVSGACVPGSPLATRIGVPVLPVRVRHKYDLAAVGRFSRLFRRRRFDIVNTHFSPDYLVPAWGARLAGQKGTVLTRHLVLPLRASRVRSYTKLYDHFIGVSEAARQMLVRSGVSLAVTSVARAGIPGLTPGSARAESRRRLGIGDEPTVGIFGRLIEEKGHEDLFAALRSTGHHHSCHVFGDGPMRAQYEAAAAGLAVVFHGYIPDIADAMDAMDLIAMPSRWEEALGIALLEAMSLGKPVVAARVGGIPEVIEDGESGILVDTTDHRAFSEAMDSLLGDHALASKLGLKARERFRSEFTPERFAERTEAVYLGVLDGRPYGDDLGQEFPGSV